MKKPDLVTIEQGTIWRELVAVVAEFGSAETSLFRRSEILVRDDYSQSGFSISERAQQEAARHGLRIVGYSFRTDSVRLVALMG